ncbi:hypothetical protein [Anabaena sp. UHCC 0451]|uniref:PFE-CTERM domain-containing protein n=1 Tax=Anabaena sp. UHCC 0451 TaxID=2055235 RepID=UPI002B212B4D|nr:hypothetical protein [Anabaena sp. UHCC 0451]MEA5579211.1 hypothetical protein [Anabaena sp. UHCC 0451]
MLLGASPANALDFNFSFQDTNGTNGFITGTVSGLVEGNNTSGPITATVTSTPNGDYLGIYDLDGYGGSGSFFVDNGVITSANAGFSNNSDGLQLSFGNPDFTAILPSRLFPVYLDNNSATTQFAPVSAAVPFELNSTVGLATLGLCFGAAKLRRNRLAKKRIVSV